MRVMRLHHHAICVLDLVRAERFYVDVLGLPVIRRFETDTGQHRSTWLDLDGAFLALERADRHLPKHDDGSGHHCFVLSIAKSEREPWRERLHAAGHPVERESDFTLYVRDPDGALIGLSHHPDAVDS